MSAIEFSVAGLPIPQGSTRAFGRGGHVHTTNDPTGRIERWRGDIRTAARPAIGRWLGPGLPWASDRPVKVAIAFRFPRPKGHFLPANARRVEPQLRIDAPRYPTSGNDVDKLTRAVLDALTAVVYADDGQVVGIAITKRYADPGEQIGADVRVDLVPGESFLPKSAPRLFDNDRDLLKEFIQFCVDQGLGGMFEEEPETIDEVIDDFLDDEQVAAAEMGEE